MDKCITLAKSIKINYLDKDWQIKTKQIFDNYEYYYPHGLMPMGKIMNIPIEVDNKALPKKKEKNDILFLLLDTKKLIVGYNIS